MNVMHAVYTDRNIKFLSCVLSISSLHETTMRILQCKRITKAKLSTVSVTNTLSPTPLRLQATGQSKHVAK